ncbi:MAG: response regulator [Ignavibacteriales bacterium]|nr:response regulator [Ignavibacteriales bacterium]
MSKAVDILVIDDEQVVREGVCRVCEASGLSVDSAGDAASGLERLQKSLFRLVLCDIMLPELDGFHIMRAMKKAGIQTPLIMITGCSTLQNAVTALKEGAVDFISKPFTVDELESGIQRGLRFQKLLSATSPSVSYEKRGFALSRPCPAEFHRLGNLSWVYIEKDGTGRMGVTDMFLKTVSTVKALALFEMNHELAQAAPCATLTSTDGLLHDVLCPLSGGIVRRNEQLLSHPELLEQDPYVSGWLYQIVPSNLAFELNHLIPCSQDYVI